MLEVNISWCGKLPSKNDFVQSHNDSAVESIFMRWIQQGQNHIGEQLLRSSQLTIPFFYIFSVSSLFHEADIKIYGLLFSSRDAKGRNCPFVMFTKDESHFLDGFSQDVLTVLSSLGFNFSQLHHTLDSYTVMDSFYKFLAEKHLYDDNSTHADVIDYWIQCYPSYNPLNLSAKSLTPILYRKLISR